MRKSHALLVLFVGLVLSASFAIPAEDVPETVYDDSESLPCETPETDVVKARWDIRTVSKVGENSHREDGSGVFVLRCRNPRRAIKPAIDTPSFEN